MPDSGLGAAIRAAVRDVGELPRDTEQVVRLIGSGEATRVLSGMDGPPKRADYGDDDAYRAARTRWRSVQRRVQRAQSGGQRRPGLLNTTERRRVARVARAARERAFRRRGARMRIHAVVSVSSPDPRKPTDTRYRYMPSGGPGVPIGRVVMAEVLDLLRDGEADEAGEVLLDAFGDSYGFAEFELDDAIVIKLWPEGTAEPA